MYKKYVKDQNVNYFFTNLKAESVNDHLTQKCKRSPDTRQLMFNIAGQPINIATESRFVGKDAVKPSEISVGKSNHHAHIHHGE